MSKAFNTSRRAFLQQAKAAAIASTAISWLSISHVASAAAFATEKEQKPKLFTAEQLANLQAIAQSIIPKTDTPGAGDVNCHGFVDHQLLACHSKEEQDNTIAIVQSINEHSLSTFNKGFAALSANDQQNILVNLESQIGFSEEQSGQFKFLKQLIVFGYFTSQEGATEALNYVAVPGPHKPSIPVDENTKTDGALAYY